MEQNNNNEEKVWFAMSAPYRRELRARDYLAAKKVESFVPMTKAIIKRRGITKHELVPAIHNLIFVHTTAEEIKEIKQNINYLQYRTIPVEGKNKPIIVPDKDMQQFINITQERIDELTYLSPQEINIKKGSRVRIHGGTFDGIEGIFVKIKGKRNRRLVILIEGLAAVAINAEITPDLIEILDTV